MHCLVELDTISDKFCVEIFVIILSHWVKIIFVVKHFVIILSHWVEIVVNLFWDMSHVIPLCISDNVCVDGFTGYNHLCERFLGMAMAGAMMNKPQAR